MTGVDSAQVERAIVRLLAARPPASSICPSEVARALRSGEGAWRALMPAVRDVAARMAGEARLRITRGGADLAPDRLHRGAIRLARGPRFDDTGLS